MTEVRSTHDLASSTVSAAITTRGKELSATDTVADARRLFGHRSIQVIPVLDAGGVYVGAVGRDAIRDEISTDAPLVAIASRNLPTALVGSSAADAFELLERHGATRLVVLEADGVTYRGLVCLRSDRERVCVDAECHAEPDPANERTTP